MPKLSVHMIVHSDEQKKYLPFLFDSLKKQTFSDWDMILIDNSSGASIVKMVEEGMKEVGKPIHVIDAGGNVGFAAGHNLAYKNSHALYFLPLNPDMYLMPNVFEDMVRFLDEHHETAAVSVRLMRWDFEKVLAASTGSDNKSDIAKFGFTSLIDAIGIRLFRNRRAVEWLTREQWAKDSESADVRKLYEKKVTEVFGVSGAFVAYRRSCIAHVLLPEGNLFDPTYHSYKEDLDLAYRLRNAGYTSYVILDSVAYHDRTGAGPRNMGDLAAIKNKRNQSFYVSFHSYKNHIRTLYKNEYWQNVLLDLPFILWYELKKFGFLLLTNPVIIFRGWKEIFAHLGYTRAARRAIHATRKMHWKGIRRWFLFE